MSCQHQNENVLKYIHTFFFSLSHMGCDQSPSILQLTNSNRGRCWFSTMTTGKTKQKMIPINQKWDGSTSPSSSCDCSMYGVSRRCSLGSMSMYESSWRSEVSLSLSSLFSRPSGSDSSWSCSPSLSDLSEYKSGSFRWSLSLNLQEGLIRWWSGTWWLKPQWRELLLGFRSNLLKSMDVVSSEKAVEINRVVSADGCCARVLFSLPNHGPLQEAGALQGQL